jgi:hypothetical protein
MPTVIVPTPPELVRTTGFRLGRIDGTPDVLACVPHPALIRALRSPTNAVAVEGRPVETRHNHEGILFRLRTDAGRTHTSMWLEDER